MKRSAHPKEPRTMPDGESPTFQPVVIPRPGEKVLAEQHQLRREIARMRPINGGKR